MNNFITLFLATLAHVGHLTKAEATRLNEELQSATLPDDFESAWQMVKDVFEKADVESKAVDKK